MAYLVSLLLGWFWGVSVVGGFLVISGFVDWCFTTVD